MPSSWGCNWQASSSPRHSTVANLLALAFKLIGESDRIREVIELSKPAAAELQKVWPELAPLLRDIGQRSKRAYDLAKPLIRELEHDWPELQPKAADLIKSIAPELTAQWGKDVPLPAFSVRWLQESLNKLGALPKVKEDGALGIDTSEAIMAFQKRAGFKPDEIDGWAGPYTLSAILKALGSA